jgi:hypothetical protein
MLPCRCRSNLCMMPFSELSMLTRFRPFSVSAQIAAARSAARANARAIFQTDLNNLPAALLFVGAQVDFTSLARAIGSLNRAQALAYNVCCAFEEAMANSLRAGYSMPQLAPLQHMWDTANAHFELISDCRYGCDNPDNWSESDSDSDSDSD